MGFCSAHERRRRLPETPGPYSAEIDNFRFAPTPIDVGVGGELTWTNKQNVEHTVVSDDGKFRIGRSRCEGYVLNEIHDGRNLSVSLLYTSIYERDRRGEVDTATTITRTQRRLFPRQRPRFFGRVHNSRNFYDQGQSPV